ncbi:MAG: arginine--tRNA ligase [Ignavibacteriales bacterium CG18_big_fil_WC_8_21_14_2_50_31_20]|nr:MAG: arginine--tRNA ligase [Ignavibacteriales bacterium CG18_big_fil_WC_8_21_14_2_50_31_20]
MKDYLKTLFEDASNKLDYLKINNAFFTIPNQKGHGDLSTNIAMILTKELKKNPREIANEIIENLNYDSTIIEKIEIAGPGFINFTFTPIFLSKIISQINEEKSAFGTSKKYFGKKANVEFVSANPTGPLTVGHGRNAVIGDTVANLLESVGYDVDREYYFNNAGRQMRVLGESVQLRYKALLGETVEFPEEYYQGEYIKEIAQLLIDEFGDKLLSEKDETVFKSKAETEIFKEIKATLENLDIKMKIFYNENSLYEEGKIDYVLAQFKEKDLSYEKDDAIWLKLTELGNEQDKVIVKSTGEPTYRLPDIAYHITKFNRGYDLIIDVFGSDHNATFPDVKAGIKALGFDAEKVDVLIHQFVTILEKGEVVKMSTRKANYITLDELTASVGKDVVRYFFNMRSLSSHLNFDIDLAKKQSEENPVFYLQYAHARISSILRVTIEQDLHASFVNFNLLNTEAEINLMKKLHQFQNEVLYSAENYEPHRIANYLEELAASFHRFYTECRILGSEVRLAEARISLVQAAQIVLKNGLSILGVTAPDSM